MPEAERTAAAWRLAAGLARSRTEAEAASWVARAAGWLAGADTARVWLIDHEAGYRFAGAWPEEARSPESAPSEVARAIAFGAPVAQVARAPFRSRLVVPLLRGPRPLGAIELLERRRESGAFTGADADALGVLVEAADAALQSVRDAASRETRQVAAVSRLARLFDVGRSITTALDMDDLVSVIADRARAALEAESAYLWLLDEDGERLSIAAAEGPASESVKDWTLAPGEGLAGEVAASGEPARFAEPEEIPGIDERPDAASGVEIVSAAAAPLAGEGDHLLGVVEVVNKEGGDPFDDGDLALLRELAETAAVALGNARRFDAERRASDLGALLATAQKLGASLDARQVTHTLVHQAASVLRYRRAAVGLLRGAAVEIAAVSGATFVDETLPEIKILKEIHAWASGLDEGTYVVREEDGSIDTDRPETREKFKTFFDRTGGRSFLAVPLKDDEGRVGVLTLEADEPYAFSGHDLEAAGILAALATVAIRNAILFEQIPMIRMFKPFAKTARRLQAMPRGRRFAWMGGAILAAALFVAIPVPLRVGAEARVLPELRRPVTAEVAGRVTRVLAREGDAVEPDQIVALLDDTDYRLGEGEARGRFEMAMREQERLRASGAAADAAVAGAQIQGLRADLDLWRRKIDRTRVRARVAGVVATPRIEEKVGSNLERGDVFCEVVDPGRQRIEVAVEESDAGLVAAGMPVKVKLSAFPTSSIRATVERIGVAAAIEGGRRVFLVRARLEGSSPPLRPGMTGQAKILIGPASLARVALREPARWIWTWIWGWLP